MNTTSRHVVDKHDVFYDATASGVTYYDEMGMVVHDYVHPSRFETAVNKLSSALNYICKMFPDLERLKPFFGWASTDKIKNMLNKTTQHYQGVVHYPFRKHFKSRFPGANVPRLNEWVATDRFFNDTPAMDDGIPGHGGVTMLQVFYGLTSGCVHGYPMKTEKQVGEVFEDYIRKVGAPIGLKSDNTKSELHGCTRIFYGCILSTMLNPSLTTNTRIKLNARSRM